MRQVLIFLILVFPFFSLAQFPLKDTASVKDSVPMLTKEYESVDIIPNFKWRYQIALQRVRRVYPMALEAARIIDSLNIILADTKRRSKQKKIERKTKNRLNEEFKFMIKDLYQSEGRVLTKLIYRETGLTVREILKKYRGGMSAFMYGTMAGFFNQDLDMRYNPDNNTDDYIIEMVIQDIRAGRVAFDPKVHRMTKDQYKTGMKEYRQNKRDNRKRKREKKK